MSTIKKLPSDLERTFYKKGRRKIVLVEGEDDKYTFELWFPELKNKLIFYDCGGKGKVEKWLNTFVQKKQKSIYGIRDRDLDFPDFAQIAHCYQKSDKEIHLFVLRRRKLENYLLEPNIVFAVFKAILGRKCTFQDVEETEEALIKVAKELRYVTAANILIHEYNASLAQGEDEIGYFSVKHLNESNKAEIVAAIAQRLQFSKAETERRIVPKLKKLEKLIIDLKTTHEIMDGKRFLIALKKMYAFPLPVENLYNLLCDRISQENTIHLDLTHIIQERILNK